MGYNTKNYKEQGGEKWVVGGELDITDGKMKGEIVEVSVSMSVAADVISRMFFIADEDYEVVKVQEVHGTAESSAETLTLQVERLQGTESSGSGDDLLSSAIDLKGTADTVVEGSVVSDGSQKLDAGDRLGVVISDSGTEIDNVIVQVELKRI